jgi:hypothetical protein
VRNVERNSDIVCEKRRVEKLKERKREREKERIKN